MAKTITSQLKDTSYFITKSIKKHGKKYNYSKSVYNGNREKLTIICNDCDYEFEQRPFHHYEGKGCSKCAGNIRKSNIQYIKECKAIHGDKFDYKLTKYTDTKANVKIICNKCNEIFEQRADGHISIRKNNNGGCPNCQYKDLVNRNTHSDVYKDRQTTLYFIKVENVYKIGVTLETIEKRFRKDKNIKIDILDKWVFVDGSKAYNLEQRILKEFNTYQYFGSNILVSGNSELFTKNILDDITPLIELTQLN